MKSEVTTLILWALTSLLLSCSRAQFASALSAMSAIVLFGLWIRLKRCFRPPLTRNQRTFSLPLVSFVNSIRAFLVPDSDLELNFTIKLSMYSSQAEAILKLPTLVPSVFIPFAQLSACAVRKTRDWKLPHAQCCKNRRTHCAKSAFTWKTKRRSDRSLLEVCVIFNFTQKFRWISRFSP